MSFKGSPLPRMVRVELEAEIDLVTSDVMLGMANDEVPAATPIKDRYDQVGVIEVGLQQKLEEVKEMKKHTACSWLTALCIYPVALTNGGDAIFNGINTAGDQLLIAGYSLLWSGAIAHNIAARREQVWPVHKPSNEARALKRKFDEGVDHPTWSGLIIKV